MTAKGAGLLAMFAVLALVPAMVRFTGASWATTFCWFIGAFIVVIIALCGVATGKA